ncbi:hypothetical protein HaLaN_11076 [Haematococcus lacustris]|uniref:Uncharacterized protein n=1 Tax=Haematococcus lacustris TaxID=44745 RepID=A0A699Z7W4_HAELA|nr:hypothetical protein HaLaN_11076 [Haematococcus lacustris]
MIHRAQPAAVRQLGLLPMLVQPWLTPLKPSAVRLLGRPPPQGVWDFLQGKLRLLPDGTRGSALKDDMHGVIHYPLCASGACAFNESYRCAFNESCRCL